VDCGKETGEESATGFILRRGQQLWFRLEDGNRVVIPPVFARFSELVGILPKPQRTLTIEEMDEAIRNAAVNRWLRAVSKKHRKKISRPPQRRQ
jgi:hypothetical protein